MRNLTRAFERANRASSRQKRAFLFCLTKLPWHRDVINGDVVLVSHQIERERKKTTDDGEDERHFGANGGFGVDMSTLPRAPVGSLSHRLLRNWAALLSVRQARRRLILQKIIVSRVWTCGKGFRECICTVLSTRRIFISLFLLELLSTYSLFPAQVLRQDSGGVQVCAHERTEMNHLNVASRSSAPTAV